MCHDWNKTREVPPNGFIWLSEKDLLEVDGSTPYFKDGTLMIKDNQVNEDLGYKEKNPNSITEAGIKKLFTLSAQQLKTELSKITEDFAKARVYALASQVDLTVSQLQVIEEFTGKKIDINAVKNKVNLNENNENKENIIELLLKGNFMKMKSELVKYTKAEDKELIFKLAKKMGDDLSSGKVKFLNEFCGKPISIE
jgi:hypothetical protein